MSISDGGREAVCESAGISYNGCATFTKSEVAGVIDENCRSYRKQKTIS